MQNQTMVRVVKPKKNQKIEVQNEPSKDQKVQARISSQEIKPLAEQVAGHHFFQRNYYWPGGKQAFPGQFRLHHVDKFFPFAEGGPLYVDEKHDKDARDLEAKKAFMKKLGNRYLILSQNTTLIEAMESLA